ncbi:MAG: YidC/Oxa1 family membrane protein insertase [Bacillota bacterium]|nr:YidC/Oxa1 family membrane protein insertase [Bacillota bacterium]
MKRFLQSKAKVLFVCLFLLLACTGCSNPRGSDGKTKVDVIIASEEVTIEKDKVNVDNLTKKELKARTSINSEGKEVITIPATTFGEACKTGWFDGLIVWPIAQVINGIASKTDAGWGIICTTLIIQLVVFLLTRKSQESAQIMQEIQPELQHIQDKYRDKTDERSRMMMYQETQALYKKYDIKPMGSMLVMFLQFPIMMGMYYATMRAFAVINGSFLGNSLAGTPMTGFQTLNVFYIVTYVLMIVLQLVNLKLPKFLKDRKEKKQNIRKRKYRVYQDKSKTSVLGGGGMDMYMYMTTAMIAVLYLSWPIAMSFYWCISNLIRSAQMIFVQSVLDKKTEKKA